MRDARDEGQWISLDADLPTQPPGCLWTLRTTFDLNGFDPDTARIEGRFAVDNWLTKVRLNGRSLPVSHRGGSGEMHEIKLERGFVGGENTLEITVQNDFSPPGKVNPMGVCVQWKSACAKSGETGHPIKTGR